MVNTRKASGLLAPMPPNSRTNSTANVAKSKGRRGGSSSTLSDGSSSPAPQVPMGLSDVTAKVAGKEDPIGPEFADPLKISSSPAKPAPKVDVAVAKSKAKSKSKKLVKVLPPPPPSFASTIKRTIRTIILFSFLSYAIVVCPHDSKRESSVCSAVHDISSFHDAYIRQPYIQPQIDRVLSYPHIQPVVKVSKAAIREVTPYALYAQAKLNHEYIKHSTSISNIIQIKSQPYLKQLNEHYQTHFAPHYNQYVAPFIVHGRHYIHVFDAYAEPYLEQAAVSLKQGAIHAAPYAHLAWVEAQKVPGILKIHVYYPACDLYEKFVEPQLKKMAKALDDISGSDSKASPTPTPASRFEKSFMARAAQTVAKHIELDETAEDVDEADPLTVSPDTIASEHPTPAPAQSATPSVVMDQATITPEAHIEIDRSKIISKMKAANLGSMNDDDLAEFLRDLSEDEDNLECGSDADEDLDQTPIPLTEEQIAEEKRLKDIETAEKRAQIVGRHQEWEAKMQTLMSEILVQFPTILAESRQRAVDDIQQFTHGKDMESEGQKAMKGTEAFLQKLLSKTGVSVEENVESFEKLVKKATKKFEDSVELMEQSIIGWLNGVRRYEGDKVGELFQKVKDLAGEAQADLGLDYAWLDDVTVNDWSRYHALQKTADDFKQTLIEIANGSSPDSPPNALSTALRQFSLDLRDVTLGFKYFMDDTYKKGIKALTGRLEKDSEEGKVEPGEAVSDAAGPEVSILPIVPGEGGVEGDDIEREVLENVQRVLVGKGKEQVEEAMKMAEEAKRPKDEL